MDKKIRVKGSDMQKDASPNSKPQKIYPRTGMKGAGGKASASNQIGKA